MFTDITTITPDFVKNELAFGEKLDPKLEKSKFFDCYLSICRYVNKTFFLHPTREQIEEYLQNGELKYGNMTYKCPIKSEEERKYYFRYAVGKQYIYDCLNGRGSMRQDAEAQALVDCPDSIAALEMLGLNQRRLFTK